MRISSLNLLDELHKPGYREVLQGFRERSFAKGELVAEPGRGEDLVLLLAEGRLRVYLGYEDKEFTLAVLEPGQVYATHTRAFVEGVSGGKLLAMDTPRFQRRLAEHPELTGAMLNVLGGLLKNSFSIINGLVFKDAQRRLVEHLLAEAGNSGTEQGGGVRVDLGLTTEALAKVVGATRQTVSMLLGDLVRAGELQKLGQGSWLIADTDRLASHLED